jgi:DNA-directed RNA polymerase subunit M/transcription elongation factor TFIIS
MKLCSKCRKKQALAKRQYRKKHSPSRRQRDRQNAYSYAYVYLKRGKIRRRKCVDCRSPYAHMYIPDLNEPLQVVWRCRKCTNRLLELGK